MFSRTCNIPALGYYVWRDGSLKTANKGKQKHSMEKPLSILEPYIPDLQRIVTHVNDVTKEHTSVEQILEETVSSAIYKYRIMFDLAGRLPVVYKNGKRYYRDDRLREYRNVDDFSDSIKFDS
jgi:hypothetical protein